MKTIAKYSLIAVVAAMLATSCTTDKLMDWEGGENIYFTHLLMPGSHMRAQDLIDLRFFFMPASVDEMRVGLSVTTTGELTNYDREIAFRVSSYVVVDGVSTGTGLVEGVNYDIERAVIRAGRVEDTVWVRIFRTEDLEEEGRVGFLDVTLLPNHHFNTDLKETRDAANLPFHTVLTRWMQISNTIVRPQFWGNDFFGPFSTEKFRVIGLANPQMPLAFLDGEIWNNVQLVNNPLVLNPWFLAIGHATQYWLDAWHSDPNNTPFTEINAEGETVLMSMGPSIIGN